MEKDDVYVELPRESIHFVSKEAEMMFDLSMDNDYLRQENKELIEVIKSLKTRIKTIKRRRKQQTQKIREYKKEITFRNYKLQLKNQIIKDAIKCINDYAIEDEDYSKIYNTEEKELLSILERK